MWMSSLRGAQPGSTCTSSPRSRWGPVIIFGNCTTLGIPCATASREDIARIAAAIEKDPQTSVEVDVAKQEIRFAGQTVKADVRPAARDALLNGRWDPIGELLDGMPAMKQAAVKLPYLAA